MRFLDGIGAVVIKEFRHMVHDPFTLALTFGLPVFQLLFFGYALETRISHVPTAILNLDSHAGGREFIQRLSGSPVFTVQTVASRQQLEAELRAGRVRAAIEIPADYTQTALYRSTATVHVWIDGSNPAMADYLLIAADATGLQQSLERTVAGELPVRSISDVRVEPHVIFNPDGRTAGFMIPGLVAILVQMISTLLTAISVVSERERGTLDQMLTTPLSPAAILGGKLAACGCVGFIAGSMVLMLMRWVFAIPIVGSIPLLLFGLLLVLLPSLGIGLLITSIASHQSQALQMTYLIFLPSVLISGFLYPREFMPRPMYWASVLLPTTYFVDLIRSVIIRGATLGDVLPDVGMILLVGTALIATAIALFTQKLRN